MRRGQFINSIRTVQAVLASIIVVAASAPPAYGLDSSVCGASGQTAEVTGSDNAAVDVPAVQTAVNNGGTVLLTGTFDFGESGHVLLNNAVAICGEADASGAPLTTIRRGEWTFHTPYPGTMPPTAAGPTVTIQHIHFVESRGTAIHLAYSGGASLRHNIIDQMRFRKVPAVDSQCNTRLNPGSLPPVFVACERAAIVVGPEILRGSGFLTNCSSTAPIVCRYTPHLVSGNIDVSDNKIDVSGSESTTLIRATGMFVSMYVGADVRVERNSVNGSTRTGLAIHDGIADENGRGSLLIADNRITSHVRSGFNFNLGPRAPIGMVTGFNNNPTYGTDPDRQMIPVLITNNTIDLGDPNSDPTLPVRTPPMGIIDIWNGALITGNTITVHADITSTVGRLSTSGGVMATASFQVLTHNTVMGEACNAVRIGGTVDGQERRANVGIANNLTKFQAFTGGFNRCADVWLEPASHDNTMVGNSGSVIDDGVDNTVTGLMPVKGGVGVAVSEAEHYANDVDFGFD